MGLSRHASLSALGGASLVFHRTPAMARNSTTARTPKGTSIMGAPDSSHNVDARLGYIPKSHHDVATMMTRNSLPLATLTGALAAPSVMRAARTAATAHATHTAITYALELVHDMVWRVMYILARPCHDRQASKTKQAIKASKARTAHNPSESSKASERTRMQATATQPDLAKQVLKASSAIQAQQGSTHCYYQGAVHDDAQSWSSCSHASTTRPKAFPTMARKSDAGCLPTRLLQCLELRHAPLAPFFSRPAGVRQGAQQCHATAKASPLLSRGTAERPGARNPGPPSAPMIAPIKSCRRGRGPMATWKPRHRNRTGGKTPPTPAAKR